jgi:hypothetical protein
MGLIAGIGAAVAAVATSVGVAVTATALTVGFETIAAVGAVLGVVGQVTHDKALSIAGLAIGAVGGVGALASGAGLLGSASDVLGQAPTTAADADAAAAGTVDAFSGGAGVAAGEGFAPEAATAAGDVGTAGAAGEVGVAGGEGFAPEASDAAAAAVGSVGADGNIITAPTPGAATPPAGGSQVSPSLFAATSAPESSGSASAPLPTGDASAAPTAQPVPGITGPATTAAPSDETLPLPPQNPGNVGATDEAGNLITRGTGIDPKTGQLIDVNPGSSGFLSGFLDFAKTNPVVALGALQAGGSLLSGLTSTLTPAQVGALNAQSAANDAAAALTKQQTQNLSMPKSVASSAPVTGTAQLVPIAAQPTAPPAVAPTPTGLINQGQAPVPSAPVTGKAA